MDLKKKIADFDALLNEISSELERRDPFLYDRWRAGGFRVGSYRVNLAYPSLQDVVSELYDEDEDEEDEELDTANELDDIDPNPGHDPND